MIVVFVAIFYFLFGVLKQTCKRTPFLIESLGVGSEVVFAGGLMGKVTKLEGDYAVVELNRGVEVKIQRASVISVLPEGTLNNL